MGEYVIWALPEGESGYRIGAHRADKSPLPFGAETITRVAGVDLNMMMRWIRRRVRRGWSIEKIRGTCS